MITSKKLILRIFKSLFAGRSFRYKGQEFPIQKIKGLRAFKIGGLLCIEQNPKSGSKYAALAKKGRKIMWIIDRKKNKYLLRVMDGVVTRVA